MPKGSWYRPVDQKKYGKNYDRIFKKSEWFCTKVLIGSDYCDYCKHNEKATEIQTRFFCPITGVEPNRKDCNNEDD